MTHPPGWADPTTNVAASTTEQAATASVRLCLTFVYPRIVEVIWSDAAAQHLARSQRYPGAVDIEVDWTVEAVNDIDAVQVDPTGRHVSTRSQSSATRPLPVPSSSCSPTATWTETCMA